MTENITLWLLTLAVIWISARPDLRRHGFPDVVNLQSTSNNRFILLPVLVHRPRKFYKRINAPLHRPQATWNKHGYLCLSPPDFDPNIDITIYMDIATNPGPVKSRTDNNSLNVLYLNARSVTSFVSIDNNPSNKVCKITLLQELVYGGNYEVICICETWLNNTILDSELLPGFNIFRQDRIDRIGGGVLIAVKEGLQVTRRGDLERDGVELVVAQINKANSKPVILYVYYRPPGSSSDGLNLLNNSLLSNPESSCIVLVGDFNIPSISWSDNDSTYINSGGCAYGEVLCELIGDNFLQQFIEGPTHRAGNKLDLLFCNRAETISDVLTSPSDDHDFPTDHYIIEFSICTKFTRAKPMQRVIYDYNHADFPALRRALSEAPLDIPLTDNIDDCWEQWKDKFLSVVTSFIPTHIVQDINSPPWIDGEVRHLICKKYTALRKYRKNKTAERKLKLRTLC